MTSEKDIITGTKKINALRLTTDEKSILDEILRIENSLALDLNIFEMFVF